MHYRNIARALFWRALLLIFTAPSVWGQGGVRVDADPLGEGYRSSARPQIAGTPPDSLHIVWEDYRNGRRQIGYRRGSSFGSMLDPSDQLLSSLTTDADSPQLVASPSAQKLFVAWRSVIAPGREQVRFCRSVDDGLSFSNEISVSSEASYVSAPKIAADSCRNVYACWVQEVPGGEQLMFASSGDSGLNWTTPVSLEGPGTEGIIVDFDIYARSDSCDGNEGQIVYITFVYTPDSTIAAAGGSPADEVRFLASYNGGASFGNGVTLESNVDSIYEVEICSSFGPTIFVVWNDNNETIRSRRNSFFGHPAAWSVGLVVTSHASLPSYDLTLDCDVNGDAFLAFTNVQAVGTQVVSHCAVSTLAAQANNWSPITVLSTTAQPFDNAFVRTRPQLASAVGLTVITWMEQPPGAVPNHDRYADIGVAYTDNGGMTWQSLRAPNLLQSARSGFPAVHADDGRAAVVWDERNNGIGAPESYLQTFSNL